MSRKRLSAADRRADILTAARRAFARHGLKASSLQIAAEAKISDALIFRHFPNKAALHRAVLRDLIEEQDQTYEQVGLTEAGAKGIMTMLHAYFSACVHADAEHVERVRILSANLASEGDYAKLAYRRAVRLGRGPLSRALQEAEADGHLSGPPMGADTLIMFLEHLGSGLTLTTASKSGDIGAYGRSVEERVADAVLFAAAGMGLKPDVIENHR